MASAYFRLPLNELRFFRRGGAGGDATTEIHMQEVVASPRLGIEVFSGVPNKKNRDMYRDMRPSHYPDAAAKGAPCVLHM
eukprot:m.42573 g.42573  ORF g.42573 m.42573 type:complete len:80 (-) comp14520_c0_seq1:2809-3048(-)